MSKLIFDYRNINSYYQYIIYSSIFLLIFYVSFGIKIFSTEIYLKNIFHSTEDEPIEYRQSFIRQIYFFLITTVLSCIFYKLEKNKTYTPSKREKMTSKNQRSLSEIELIYQESESIYYSKTFFLYFISLVLLWVIVDYIIGKSIITLQQFGFWMFELIFLSLFYRKYFKVEIYIHQKIAMILNVIPFLLKLVLMILSSFDKSLKDLFSQMSLLFIILIFIFYLLIIILKSFIITKLKWYMDKKYISFTKILIYYGLIGSIYYSVISTVSTFKDCEKTYDSNINIYDVFCENKIFNETSNETIKYIANFKLYFSSYKNIKELFLEIMTVFLCALGFFFSKYFSLMTIKYLSPIHLMLANSLLYIFSFIIIIIILYIDNNLFNNALTLTLIILNFIGDIFCLIFILIYLEILELNFCGLNLYLRKTIIERGLEDLYKSDEDEDENENDNPTIEDDDEDKKEEKKI